METKANLKSETIEALQELIESNRDSAECLREAAASVSYPSTENLFDHVSKARFGHVQELQNYVRGNGEEPETSGSAKGTARRYWLKLRSAINSGNPKVVLIEAEKAEDEIKAKYESLLVEIAGSAMSDVLHRQYREVKRHHDLIRDLRDSAVAA